MDLREFRVVVRIVDRVAKRALFAEEQMVALEGQCAEWRRIADELKAELNLTTVTAESVIKERDALSAQLDTERERHKQTAAVPQSVDVPRTHPVPCDPPEATHITPDGKATAQAAVTPQPGDVVRLVRVPTNDEYPHDSGRWEPNWGGIGDYMRVHYVGSNINGTRVVRAVFGLEWPLSCVEVVKGGDK